MNGKRYRVVEITQYGTKVSEVATDEGYLSKILMVVLLITLIAPIIALFDKVGFHLSHPNLYTHDITKTRNSEYVENFSPLSVQPQKEVELPKEINNRDTKIYYSQREEKFILFIRDINNVDAWVYIEYKNSQYQSQLARKICEAKTFEDFLGKIKNRLQF